MTFVTSYFRVPSKHTPQQYAEWIGHLLQEERIRQCLLVFTDSPELWLQRGVAPTTRRRGVVVVPTSLCEEGRALNRSRAFWWSQFYLDPEARTHRSYQLYLVWNLKPHFLTEAVRLNCFASDRFYWIDAGYMRTAPRPPPSSSSSVNISGVRPQMTFLQVNPFESEERRQLSPPYHYTTVKNRIAGGLYGGSPPAVLAWAALYARVFQEYVERGWFVGKDQNLMATLCVQHPFACVLATPNTTADENRWFTLWECLIGERTCAYRHYDSSAYYYY
jgi:hypothetical protein